MKPHAMAAALADEIKRINALAVQAHALARISAFALRNATEGLAEGEIELADFARFLEMTRDIMDDAGERAAGSLLRVGAYALRHRAAGKGHVDLDDLAHVLDAARALMAEAAGLNEGSGSFASSTDARSRN